MTNYAAWRAELWSNLAKRYPNDHDIDLIRRLDTILSGQKETPSSQQEEHVAPPFSGHNVREHIKLGAVDYLKEKGAPAFAAELDPYLRKRQVALPQERRSSSSLIAGVLSENPDLFKKVALGSSVKRTAKWELV